MGNNILLIGNFLDSPISSPAVGVELAIRLRKNGRKVITASSYRNRFTRLIDMLFTILWNGRDCQIAQVDVFSGPAFIWAEVSCWALRMVRKPYILTLHGGNLPAFARLWPRRVKRLLRSAGAVTAPSLYLPQEMGTYREDIILIPNPLDINNYPFWLRSAPKPKLVWLRAFHEIYHPQMAPLVVNKLSKYFPEISLTMIGPDKGDGTLQETQVLIANLGLQNKVKIVSGISKSKVPEYLEQADIFINTTNVDNTPISILEAMACGLCVVSTNVGGIPYMLDGGQDAMIVPPNDPEAMANAVHRVLTDIGLAERLSQNARKKAQQFDWPVILKQWEDLFDEVVNA